MVTSTQRKIDRLRSKVDDGPKNRFRCARCDEPREVILRGPVGSSTWCISCVVRRSLPGRLTARARRYVELLKRQPNVCAICGGKPKELMGLHVDHCHTLGHDRGLLCMNCNVGLGFFGDNPARLREAAQYLERNVRG